MKTNRSATNRFFRLFSGETLVCDENNLFCFTFDSINFGSSLSIPIFFSSTFILSNLFVKAVSERKVRIPNENLGDRKMDLALN